MDTAKTARAGIASPLAGHAKTATFMAGLRRLARAWRIRRDRARLQAMPDHMLRDLGISRGEIDFVIGLRRHKRP